jgi:hypothetical protein
MSGPIRPDAAPRTPTSVTSVICPVCHNTITLEPDPTYVYEWVTGESRYRPLDLSTLSGPLRDVRRRASYVACPRGGNDPHYLPTEYSTQHPPIVIGLVGRPESGKTHLLVAMLAELLDGAGLAHGLTYAGPIDRRQHSLFERTMLNPFRGGQRLPGTRAGARGFADAVQLDLPDGTRRTLVLYDLVGEDFVRRGDATPSEFLVATSAVLFVEGVDAVTLRGNEWIDGGLDVLQSRHGGLPPAALVLTKADAERYTEPIDRWLRAPDQPPTAERLHAESRDVYAWLEQRGATKLLEIVARTSCSLHVVSATGSAPTDEGRFARGVRSVRVLGPLAAVLHAAGLLPEQPA